MLRNLKSIRGDTKSVSEIIGLILMVTIALVEATTVQVYISGAGGDSKVSPIVGMMQTGNHLSITDIQHGPISNDSIRFDVYDSGNPICEADLTPNGENLAEGDTVTFNNCPLTSGEAYFVLAIYEGNQVGRQKFIVP